MAAPLVALAAGLLFGLGLLVSGMTDPAKVQGFLDLAGAWDPSLALVMGGAIAAAMGAFEVARSRVRKGLAAWTGVPIEWPTSTVIDRRLIGGGVLFGVGWGLSGFCPGPALVAASAGYGPALWFLAAMLTGMGLYDEVMLRRGVTGRAAAAADA